MSEELKRCPFCGTLPNTLTLHGISETRYFCPNSECPNSERTVTLEQWQSRPIEDKLNARIVELKARITEAIAILEDEMGEWVAVAPLYLPDHYLQLKQAMDTLEGKESDK